MLNFQQLLELTNRLNVNDLQGLKQLNNYIRQNQFDAKMAISTISIPTGIEESHLDFLHDHELADEQFMDLLEWCEVVRDTLLDLEQDNLRFAEAEDSVDIRDELLELTKSNREIIIEPITTFMLKQYKTILSKARVLIGEWTDIYPDVVEALEEALLWRS